MRYLPMLNIPKSSARVFWRTAKKPQHYSVLDFLHGYIYARWPYFYIGVGTGEYKRSRKFFQMLMRIVSFIGSLVDAVTVSQSKERNNRITFADNYHGKVVPLEPASQLVMIRQAIDLPNLEQVIPYKRAKDIVMQNPDHLVALDCPCRVSRQSPCLPLDVCIIVGEPFASFVIEHHPSRARWISRGEAEKILSEEDERGHVHHAFLRMQCLGAFMQYATVVPAVAGRCRHIAMEHLCWLLRVYFARWTSQFVVGVEVVLLTASLRRYQIQVIMWL